VAAAAIGGGSVWHSGLPRDWQPCNTIKPLRCECFSAFPDDAENIGACDETRSEQAVMAMDSLYIAYSKDAKPANAAEVRAAINALFQQL